MAENPALIVRVVANLDELRKGMAETTQTIQATTKEIESLGGGAQLAGGQLSGVGSALESSVATVAEATGAFAALRGGLNGIAEAAGLTFVEMGLVGTATAMIATGFGAWKLTRAAMEFLDLDGAVAKAATGLLGWGDIAVESAGAKADVLAKATKNAGREITDLDEAMRINAKVVDEWTNVYARAQGPVESARQIAAWHAEIDLVRSAGVLDGLTKDIESHAFSMKDLGMRYGVSVAALQNFSRETKDATAISKAAADESSAWAAVMRELEAAGKGWKATVDEIDGSVVEAIQFYLQAGVSQATLAKTYGLTTEQIKACARALEEQKIALKASDDAAIKAGHAGAAMGEKFVKASEDASAAEKKHHADLAETKRLTDEAVKAAETLRLANMAVNRAMGNATQVDTTTQAGRDKIDPNIDVWLKAGYSLAQASAIAFANAWGVPLNPNDPLFTHKGPREPGYAGGVTNAPGGWSVVGELGPERMWVPKGSNIYPTGSTMTDRATDAVHNAEVAATLAMANTAEAQMKAALNVFDRAQKLGVSEAGVSLSVAEMGVLAKDFLGTQATLKGLLDKLQGLDPPRSAPQVINLVVDGRVLASIVNDQNTKTLKQSRQLPSA